MPNPAHTATAPAIDDATATLRIPLFHVVLLDDNDHTYDYVIEMLMAVFGHTAAKAMSMAVTVDTAGRVIVETTHRERAEHKRDQIRSYGPDWRIPRSPGSMEAIIELAAEDSTS
jgi:ATP-dependent Clp protease adaptor protein ClpS